MEELKRKQLFLRLTYLAYYGLVGLIAASCIIWALWWMMSTEPYTSSKGAYLDRIETHIKSRFFRTDGYYGSDLIYESGPFIIVALASFAVIGLRNKIQAATKERHGTGSVNSKPARFKISNLTTLPLVIKSPMGVLTAADLLFICTILFLCAYTFGRACYLGFIELEKDFKENPSDYTTSVTIVKVAYAGYYMGRSAMIPFALLWIPVSRGSPFLRLINMPFEHAVKYHIWLSMLSVGMLLLHGILYIAYYVHTHNSKEIVSWYVEGESCSVVAGVIAAIAGAIMWVTSLSFFRRRWYEIFFGIHHLYIVFFVFWLYHVMWTIHFFIIPCLLFVVDRFLRMVQSRQSVNVLSAKLLESGSIELNIAKSNTEGLAYHALSSWYLRFPSLSSLMKLQWHFFSVTSTQMDEKEELSIVIKPLGKWTALLKEKIVKYSKLNDGIKRNRCPFTFNVGVEGPYGDESNFFLEYNVLILVGGGIGVTPLLALLRDVLHRYRQGEKNLPSRIHLYHCVRKPEELCVLNSIDPNDILPDYLNHGLDIQVFVYVTSRSSKDYSGASESQDTNQVLDLATFEGTSHHKTSQYPEEIFFSKSGPHPRGISSVSTRGQTIWVALIIFSSIVGFYVLYGLSNVFLVKQYDAYFTNYSRTHVVVASMILGTVLFGGIPTFIWWLKIKLHQKSKSITRSSSKIGILNGSPSEEPQDEPYQTSLKDEENMGLQPGSPWNGTILLRSRPSWKEIFVGLNKEYQGQDIGVLVSGGLSMQEDIAEECRSYGVANLVKREATSNNFHYHPISFDL